jgi:hypothetical protein
LVWFCFFFSPKFCTIKKLANFPKIIIIISQMCV